MKFMIVGAGSIGCYVGARLTAAGQQVAFVGRPHTTEPLASRGLVVTDLDGFKAELKPAQLTLHTRVADAWSGLKTNASQEVNAFVLLCVKGGATASATTEIAASCPEGTMVVSLQNGVDNVARIAHAAPALQAIAGMVPYNVVMPSPDRVHRATTGSIYLADTPATRALAAVFNASGLPTLLSEDMASVQWGKLLLNLNNPVNALSNLPLVQELGDRDFRRVLAALQTEALQAMARAGIRPAKISKAPPKLLPTILRLPNVIFKRIAANMLRMDASARSSMWEDLQRGRTTEIDDLCGAVVRLAQSHGSAAPRNKAMCELLAAYQPDQSWTGGKLRQAIQ